MCLEERATLSLPTGLLCPFGHYHALIVCVFYVVFLNFQLHNGQLCEKVRVFVSQWVQLCLPCVSVLTVSQLIKLFRGVWVNESLNKNVIVAE